MNLHDDTPHNRDAHQHGVSRHAQRRALWIALIANGGFLIAEVVGGLALGSLALLADGAHMLSDVAGLAVALVAQRLLDRPATERHSYGLQRAEVLGALANALMLVAVSVWIVIEAVGRFNSPGQVRGGPVAIIAVLGLAVNVASALVLARAEGGSLNMRGALIHMVVDAFGSVVVIISGLVIVFWALNWVDPVASLLLAGLVLLSTWGLLRDTVHVLLEGAPRGLDPHTIEAALLSDADVAAVHHLHLWNLASDVPALSAHVVVEGEATLHEAQTVCERLKTMLEHLYGISHSTLELECHPCEPLDTVPTGGC